MEVKARVVPNAKRFAFKPEGGVLKVHCTEKPEGGKATAEVLKGLGKALGCEVRLVRGAKSRDKVLWIADDAKAASLMGQS